MNSHTDRTRESFCDPHTIKVQVRDMRRFIEHRLGSLSALWEVEPQIARGDCETRWEKILKPMLRTYLATEGLAWRTRTCGCYGGAGGQNRA
jgi:hypothetical protein